MKKNNFSDSKLGKFLSGKGFYAALCASIVTVGAAGYLTYRSTTNRLEDQLSGIKAPAETSAAADVNVPKTDVPKGQESTGKATGTPSVTSAPAAATPSGSGKAKDSKGSAGAQVSFAMPIMGEVTNGFSGGELVKSKTLGSWKTHDGIDIAAKPGDPVKAVYSGTVSKIYEDPMWGVCIIVDHGSGLEGHYYNLNKIVPVKVDQKITVGTTLGSVGDTAEAEIAEASHLHFGMKKDGHWTDPLTFLKPQG